MNPSRRGLSGAAKGGIVVILVLVVLAGAYFAPSALSGGSGTTTLSTVTSTASGSQEFGLLSLFGYFSQMQVQTILNTATLPDGSLQKSTMSYLVLGKGTFDSVLYTKVEFSQLGAGNSNVIAWFNSTGVVNRLDIIGGRNYSGPGAAILAQTYTIAFGLIPVITNNSTLLSMLAKVSQNTTSIGPTKLDVSYYQLAAPTPLYKTVNVGYATVPGTNQRFVVYLYEKTLDGAETTVQVMSVTK